MREEKNGQNGWSNLSKHLDTAYYLQDELGSPIRLLDEEGNMRETYGYDEFGQDLYRNQGQIQPFGYTGYQSDRIAETYYAQAREYRAELGRFAGVDIIKGFAASPYTLNEYGYCWGNPMVLVDTDGKFPLMITANIIVQTMYLYCIIIKDEHYGRNQNQEEYFSQYTDDEIIKMVELGEDGWKPAPDDQNAYHRFTSGEQGDEAAYNVKFLKEFSDGTSYEVVICQPEGYDDDYIVRDPKNAGTYNYCNPDSGVIGHWWNDVVPYWFFGNSIEDNLKWYERLFGSDFVKSPEPDYTDTCNGN